MIKYNCKNINFWVDQDTGSLNIETKEGTTIIPYEEGSELLSILKKKVALFEVKEQEKRTLTQKFKHFISFRYDWQNSLY